MCPLQRFDSRSFALGGAASTRFVPQLNAEPSDRPQNSRNSRRNPQGLPPNPPATNPDARDSGPHTLPPSQPSFQIPDPKSSRRSTGSLSQGQPLTQMGTQSGYSGFGASQGSYDDFASQSIIQDGGASNASQGGAYGNGLSQQGYSTGLATQAGLPSQEVSHLAFLLPERCTARMRIHFVAECGCKAVMMWCLANAFLSFKGRRPLQGSKQSCMGGHLQTQRQVRPMGNQLVLSKLWCGRAGAAGRSHTVHL